MLFYDILFIVNEYDWIGVIGVNGFGKMNLLDVLVGIMVLEVG